MILFNEKLQRFYDTNLKVTNLTQITTNYWKRVHEDIVNYPISLMLIWRFEQWFKLDLSIVQNEDWTLADVDYQGLKDLLIILNSGFYVKSDLTHIEESRPSQYHIWDDVASEWAFSDTPENIASHLKLLTRRQFKLALLQNNLLDDIDAAIAAIADPLQKAIIQIEYQESTTFERNSPSVVAMLGILGLSDVQANEMWLQGLAI